MHSPQQLVNCEKGMKVLFCAFALFWGAVFASDRTDVIGEGLEDIVHF